MSVHWQYVSLIFKGVHSAGQLSSIQRLAKQ
jgi:hypothetical protein